MAGRLSTMSYVVCFILFFTINGLGLRYILSNRTYILKPSFAFAENKWHFSGPEMFLLLTLFCAPIDASPPGMLALRLLLWLILVGLGICLTRKSISPDPVIWAYGLYLGWLLISLFITPQPWYGFRVFFKYLLPFLLLIYLPGIVRNPLLFPKAVKAVYWIFFIVIITFIMSVYGLSFLLIPLRRVFWWGPAIVDSLSVLVPVIFVYAAMTRKKRFLLLLTGCFLYPLAGYVVRTGLVAMLVSLIAMSIFRYRLKALPVVAAVLAIGVGIFIFVPQVRDKTFRNDLAPLEILSEYQEIEMDDINSNARFYIWNLYLNRFYRPKPLTGSGIGVLQEEMYTKPFGSLNVIHNDYVQILCDTGLIGLVLYGMVFLLLIWRSFLLYRDRQLSDYTRYAAFIAGTSLCGMAAAMMTDNVVNYTMTTLIYPFSFYAIALGLKRVEQNVQCHNPAV